MNTPWYCYIGTFAALAASYGAGIVSTLWYQNRVSENSKTMASIRKPDVTSGFIDLVTSEE